MNHDFSGKTVVITGASKGIGAVTARTFANAGARVVLVARSRDKLDALAAELPHDPVVVVGDLLAEDGWKQVAEAVLGAVEGIDVLVNNAGVAEIQSLRKLSTTPEAIDKSLMINVRNLMLLTSALSQSLVERRGNIVNISSVSSFSGFPGQISYSTTKGAVNGFTRNATFELGPKGVRVNAVAPGRIDDGMWTDAFARGVSREELFERNRPLIPLEGRWGKAQEVANAVVFLASDAASYITGQILRVDGGIRE